MGDPFGIGSDVDEDDFDPTPTNTAVDEPWRCNYCGVSNNKNYRFCNQCGYERGYIPPHIQAHINTILTSITEELEAEKERAGDLVNPAYPHALTTAIQIVSKFKEKQDGQF